MKYHALIVIFEKKKQKKLKLLSAANYRWRFMGLAQFRTMKSKMRISIHACEKLVLLALACRVIFHSFEVVC